MTQQLLIITQAIVAIRDEIKPDYSEAERMEAEAEKWSDTPTAKKAMIAAAKKVRESAEAESKRKQRDLLRDLYQGEVKGIFADCGMLVRQRETQDAA